MLQMKKSPDEDLPLVIRYGPYQWNGIVQHRLQRLYGITRSFVSPFINERLEELGYRFTLQPHDIWDYFDVSYANLKLFKCRVTLFKYNCTWERDPTCRRAVAAVETQVPFVREALKPRGPPVTADDFAVYPPFSVLYELLHSIELPEGPAAAVLEQVLDTVYSIDDNKMDFMRMLDEMFADNRLTYRILVRIKSIVQKLPLEWFHHNDLLELVRTSIITLTSRRTLSISLTDISDTIFQMFISNLTRYMFSNNIALL